MRLFCSTASMICKWNENVTFFFSLIKLAIKIFSCLLSEMEEAVVGQTQEGTAGHDDVQQMVQFSESSHLLLQIDFRVQIIPLRKTLFLWWNTSQKCQMGLLKILSSYQVIQSGQLFTWNKKNVCNKIFAVCIFFKVLPDFEFINQKCNRILG